MNDYKSIEPYQLSIADGMIDWVRVVDKNNVVLYVNKKMQEDLKEDIVGKKCFDVLCRDKRCDFCISSITMESGNIMRKQQKFRDKTYMIISSPLYGKDGEIEGSVEVFRDITKEVLLAEEINERNRKMSEDIKFAKNMQERMLPPKGVLQQWLCLGTWFVVCAATSALQGHGYDAAQQLRKQAGYTSVSGGVQLGVGGRVALQQQLC